MNSILLLFFNIAASLWLPMVIPNDTQVKLLKLPDSNAKPLKCLNTLYPK